MTGKQSMILGIMGVALGLSPFMPRLMTPFALMFCLLGLLGGLNSYKSDQHRMALTGIVLCGGFFVLVVVLVVRALLVI